MVWGYARALEQSPPPPPQRPVVEAWAGMDSSEREGEMLKAQTLCTESGVKLHFLPLQHFSKERAVGGDGRGRTYRHPN